MNGEIDGSDCVVIVTDHSGVDYESILRRASLVVDTRNALHGLMSDKLPVCKQVSSGTDGIRIGETPRSHP
jgi:UDP-N-acetyl-D-mannosaminuronate dehydrogenase